MDLNDRIRAIGSALSKAGYRCPVPNDTAEIGCGGCVNKVPLELSVELVALSCMALAEMHAGDVQSWIGYTVDIYQS
jgi:hypothetical protein